MSQERKNYKEVSIIKSSEVINVSADTLWAIVREFQNVGQWFSSIDRVTVSDIRPINGGPYTERTCHVAIKGYDTVHEKLTQFDDTKMQLAYELTEGGPGFLLFAGNQWSVHEVGPNQSVLKMHATMRLKKLIGALLGWQLKRTVEKNLPLALNELKIFAETGTPAKSKMDRVALLDRKKKRKAA